MEEKKRFGWTEKGIVGAVFAPIGLIFLIVGVALWMFTVGGDPEDPWIFLGVFGGMGALFLILGLGFLLSDCRRRAAQKRAWESGSPVMAKIAGVRVRTNVSTNGAHPCTVECHYQDPDSKEVHVYFSRYLYFDPTDMFTADEVPVYLDRLGGREAFVDIDAVLPKVVMHR